MFFLCLEQILCVQIHCGKITTMLLEFISEQAPSSLLFKGINEGLAFQLSGLREARNPRKHWMVTLAQFHFQQRPPCFNIWVLPLMCNHTCACLPLTHLHKHNTFAEIKWLQCMTHFAEAGFCFHNHGVWVSACVYECLNSILHRDDAARQPFKSWKRNC